MPDLTGRGSNRRARWPLPPPARFVRMVGNRGWHGACLGDVPRHTGDVPRHGAPQQQPETQR